MHHQNLIHAGAFGKKEAPDPNAPELAERHVHGETCRLVENELPAMAEHLVEGLVKYNFVFKGSDPLSLKAFLRSQIRDFILQILMQDGCYLQAVERRTDCIRRANEKKANAENAKRQAEKERRIRETAQIEHEKSELMAFRKAALDLLSVEDFMLIRDLAASELAKPTATA